MNKLRIVLAFALVLMLSSLATSAPESTQLGPYAVTFDMNTDMDYQLVPLESGETEVANLYAMQISTDNSTGARLVISEYKMLIDSTLAPQKQISTLNLILNGFNITNVDDTVIDGKEGYMVSGVPFPYNTDAPADSSLIESIYWMDSVKCDCGPVSVGTTMVSITSSYPEDVTMNLINSLKVVKGEAMAASGQGEAMTAGDKSQVLPPE